MTPADGAVERPDETPLLARSALADRYAHVRAQTVALTMPLSAEDQTVQSMPDASPAKWHLAHTTWFFETFLLAPQLPDYQPFDPAVRLSCSTPTTRRWGRGSRARRAA